VELHDGERWGGGGSAEGYYALAGVVAFLRAGPEEEAVVESWTRRVLEVVERMW
jgi:hypothetical protein